MVHVEHCNYSYPDNANHNYHDLCNDGYMESMGKRIKRIREDLKLTQQEVATRVGVSRVAVTKWENGDTDNLKLKNVVAILKLFKIRFNEFMGEPDDPDLIEGHARRINDGVARHENQRQLQSASQMSIEQLTQEISSRLVGLPDIETRSVVTEIEKQVSRAQRLLDNPDPKAYMPDKQRLKGGQQR